MIPKRKLMRLFTLQQRLESIIKDFNNSDISTDILFQLDVVSINLNNLIDYVRSES